MAALGSGAVLAPSADAATQSMSVCGAATYGHAHCDASLLVIKGTHRLFRPTVQTAVRGRSAHSTAVTRPAEPSAGSPLWLQQAYDLTALSATRGAGDTVAVVDAYDDHAAASDLAVFRSAYGLPACTETTGCLQVVNQQGARSPLPAPNSAWSVEETMDIQAVSAICPNCKIILVEASSSSPGDLQAAMQAAANLGANQISDSWSQTASSSPFTAGFVSTPAGSTPPAIFAASGDAGSDALGSAEYPAALPTVTAVGGTTLFTTDRATSLRGYRESVWASAGSGCATGEPALSYQPITGCQGRAYSDISADADPITGLNVYQAAEGGWARGGGTSLSTPLVAAFDAITGVSATTPDWAYTFAGDLNDPTGGSNGECSGLLALMCTAGSGYHGPTGTGSISGAIVAGAPGISGPTFERNGLPTDAGTVTSASASLLQGLYPNGEATTYQWEYGTTTRYGQQTTPMTLGPGATLAQATAKLTGLSAGTTYFCRLVATNTTGTSDGYTLSFRTPGVASHRRARSRSRSWSRSISHHG